jgi:glycosyltransferase involved in cell wall biosynthesis
MSESVFISIALPVYNGAKYLREALDSVCAQKFTEFELVVSDNASTDETPRICEEYAYRDPRIKVNRSERFLEQADNVNRAVSLCSGEWVKLFCHDDLMAPACMARIQEFAAKCPPQVGLIGNGTQWLFMNGYRYPETNDFAESQIWPGPQLIRNQLKGKRTPPLPCLTTAAVRRSAWESSSKFDSRFLHFDVYLWTRLLVEFDYAFIPESLTVYRIHGEQVAVSARKSMRSIADQRSFWPEFVRDCGDSLRLDRWERLMAKLRPLGTAGSAVAIEVLCGNPKGAVTTFAKTPLAWWPALPAFILRSYRSEKRKVASLLGRVPVREIYP